MVNGKSMTQCEKRVSAREWEREGGREGEGERERRGESVCVHVCVCMCRCVSWKAFHTKLLLIVLHLLVQIKCNSVLMSCDLFLI